MEMPLTDPQSESEVLRATTILLIQVQDVSIGPWEPEAEGELMERELSVQIIIEEVLKGEVRQNIGEPFEFTVTQRGTGSFRVMDYYGLWSHVIVNAGSRFIAFCRGEADDARLLLTDNYCEQLIDPDVGLIDTREALALAVQDISTEDILTAAAERASQCGDIFARFVWALIRSDALRDIDTFETIINLLEAPGTNEKARQCYLSVIYESLSITDPPLRDHETRFIQAMFQLVTLPEAASLHQSIGGVFLPNLVGLNKDAPDYGADEVFATEEDRATQLTALQSETEDYIPQLTEWLTG